MDCELHICSGKKNWNKIKINISMTIHYPTNEIINRVSNLWLIFNAHDKSTFVSNLTIKIWTLEQEQK
jgi:hypothetical protein